jgi:chromosome segregation ATPase
METNGGHGKADAQSGDLAELRRQFAEFGEVQANQSRTLDIHTGKLNALERATNHSKLEMHLVKSTLTAVREEFSGRFERLDSDVAGLRREITGDGGLLVGFHQEMIKLRDDVTGIEVKVDTLQTDVSDLKTDVSDLKTDVSDLKTDVSDLKTDMADVKGSLKEILNRLPAKAA